MKLEDKDLREEPLLCLICAWREHCSKKFSFTGGHCVDFTRDITVKLPGEEPPGAKPEKK